MSNSSTIKRKNHLTHCEDGPAVTHPDGSRMWYMYGVKHRLDGPAVEWADGTKEWWVAGFRHRKKGLAIEHPDGTGLNFYSDQAAKFEKLTNIIDLGSWLKSNRSHY